MSHRPVLDAQVHVYARDRPEQPWREGGEIAGRDEVTGADMLAAMDATGVDRAILVSYFNPYGFDAGYALSVAAGHPDRFRVVAPVDVTRSDAEDVVRRLAAEPHVVGLRVLMFSAEVIRGILDGSYDAFFRAAREHALPVSLMTWETAVLVDVVARHSDNALVVDHLGIRQPHTPDDPVRGLEGIDHLLGLGAFAGVFLKASGVPTLSREHYPFDDLWPGLDRLLDRFGTERCMWGSDWTRVLPIVSYEESLGYLRDTDRLSETEKDQLLGGTAAQVYGWPDR